MAKRASFQYPEQPSDPSPTSPTLSPQDHVALLVGMLKHAEPELIRRWVAALLMVDEADRQRVVEAVEARIVETYTSVSNQRTEFDLVHPPKDKQGYIEQVVTTYAVRDGTSNAPAAKPGRAS
jgi:hypothetical protein